MFTLSLKSILKFALRNNPSRSINFPSPSLHRIGDSAFSNYILYKKNIKLQIFNYKLPDICILHPEAALPAMCLL